MENTAGKKVTAIGAPGEEREAEIDLVVEEPLEIRINGVPYAVVMRTPGYEMELVAGFCFTEGIVDSISGVLSMGFCADAAGDARNVVSVIVAPKPEGGGAPAGEAVELRMSAARSYESRSSCGICGVRMLEDVEKKIAPIVSDMKVRAEDVFLMQERMEERQVIGARTRAAHAAGLFRPDGDPIVVREDVGRHNALDRIIGHALLNGIDCGGCVAFLSSRISFEMAQKAARARIPIVAAVSAATSLAVELADRANCTLAGRVRGESMVVYTHPQRIIS
jgi:FdhD protein